MVSIRTSKIETRARTDLPCREKNAPRKKLRKCVDDFYQRTAGCKFPWHDEELGISKDCNATTEPAMFANFLDDLPKSKQGLYKHTGCHHQCEYLVGTTKYEGESLILNLSNRNKAETSISIQVSSSFVRHSTPRRSYRIPTQTSRATPTAFSSTY